MPILVGAAIFGVIAYFATILTLIAIVIGGLLWLASQLWFWVALAVLVVYILTRRAVRALRH